MLILETAPDTISEYERKMRIHEDVIRYMTIKVDGFEDKPSIMIFETHENSKDSYQMTFKL